MARVFAMDDFIGFTYNGQHSSLLGIYRVSSGNRYEESLTPVMTDKTAEVPGGDGQYYFGTTFKSRNFKVDFAFYDLNDTDIRNLKRLFSGDGLHDLIFDETPYKAWSAKVTGTPTLKYIPFDDGDSRIYKGEGSLTFTCYDPFAHTPKKLWAPNQDNPDQPDFYYGDLDGKNSDNYSIEAYPNKDEWLKASGLDDTITTIKGDVPPTAVYTLNCNTITNFEDNRSRIAYLVIRQTINGIQKEHKITFQSNVYVKTNTIITWDTKTGLCTRQDGTNPAVVLPYTGNGIVKLEPQATNVTATCGGISVDNINIQITYDYLYL